MTREEAINVIRSIYQTDAEKEALAILVPELRESEDERIRKWIASYIHRGVFNEEEHPMALKAIEYLEKQKYDRMKPIYDARESFEYALEKAWNDYHNGYENVDKLEDDYVECAYAKGFREGYLFGVEKQKEQKVDIDKLRRDLYQSGYNDGYQHGKEDAQKEQKPDYADEYKKCLEDRDYFIKNHVKVEQKPAECGCTNDESEYDKGHREGHRFGLQQTQEYMLPGGRTFMGLIPCWVNAPSELQPAHKYHGKNAVIMHENNGGFRCCFIDDEKATTVHLPENTLFVEGWRKKPAEWSEEDEKMLLSIISDFAQGHKSSIGQDKWLKSLRPQPQGTYKQVIHTIFGMLKDKDFYEIQPSYRVSLLNDIRVKCKDAIECAPILDEPSWKPSKEQMNELFLALIPGAEYDCDILEELYYGLSSWLDSIKERPEQK